MKFKSNIILLTLLMLLMFSVSASAAFCENNDQCNDRNVCTDDECVENQCIYAPNSNSCDDGDACTGNDFCSGGQCIGETNLCGGNLLKIFLGFDIAENLLKEKLLFMLHIIKEDLFQTEFKIIESSLMRLSCDELPISYSITKGYYEYAKLEEVDKVVSRLLRVVEENPDLYPGVDIELARELLQTSEGLIYEEPKKALDCKKTVYDLLQKKPIDPTCDCPLHLPEPTCEELCTSPGYGCCDEECVDLQNDPANCGQCGNYCNYESCYVGQCVD